MHVLIVDNSPKRLELGQLAFIEAGLDVTGSGSLAVAYACLGRAPMDILVIDRRSAGQHFAQLVRKAEERNPHLVTITLTPDVAGDTDRLVQAFPSVHAVLGAEIAPAMAAKIAMASIVGQAMCPAQVSEPIELESAFEAEPMVKAEKPAPLKANPILTHPDRALTPQPEVTAPVFSSRRTAEPCAA